MEDGLRFHPFAIAYPYYLQFDRSRNILPEEVYHIDEQKIAEIDQLVALAHKHDMHVSLNLHPCSGILHQCGLSEPYNLWTGPGRAGRFYFHWTSGPAV